MTSTNAIQCATCTAVTYDPDRWDPEASTGIVYCDRCWDTRPTVQRPPVDPNGEW